jgi:hypothetical protein
MRPIKLVTALAAAASVLALIPAVSSAIRGVHRHHAALHHARALAHRHAAVTGACRITLEAPRVITAGEKATVFGHVVCPAAATVKEVTILQRPLPRRGHVSTIASHATIEGTAFKFEVAPMVNTLYRAEAAGLHSGQKAIRVAPVVTLKEPPEGTMLLTGRGATLGARHNRLANAVTFKGTVNPFYPGEIVALQRENSTANEEWHRIDLGTVNAQGEYSITHVFGIPGDANLRVVAHPRGGNVAGASSASSYVISEPQNPALTINASADPIAFGQSVTLSGIAAGASSKPVTLLARNAGSPFAPVASGTTGPGGQYSFTAFPLRNTAYQVMVGTTKSAILFEGVKYALTPAPTSTTVQAGQPVTLSGAVAPVHAGHVIYLERQNLSGVNYHVVEVGTVSAGGTYSISHVFLAPGVAKLRVKIPGDPENQGAAGSPIEVTITPAPAGSLRPLRHERQPSEGQV